MILFLVDQTRLTSKASSTNSRSTPMRGQTQPSTPMSPQSPLLQANPLPLVQMTPTSQTASSATGKWTTVSATLALRELTKPATPQETTTPAPGPMGLPQPQANSA